MQTLTQKTEKLKKDPKKKPVCKDRTKFFKKRSNPFWKEARE